ncbi:PEP-CTERM sorting domain-containing protein [Luteolibacter sp. GHJ8]|uniref:PEP-CTERM sorting domain-containing protein n=1 Tax=Luteolibacter rhizosphaerae TaxID=2989719 RepID=A0ABT3G4X4_9BACT|nr:PEP-CTERM sorting domain-containing protein [Luteolibacter rhizosphaerae]MCW1914905.1 PEP-CTERM sorting domain-containing protein [Luteolibacter rhizosphaerae]
MKTTSILGLLAAGLFAASGSADAAIVYSGVVNLSIPTNFDGIYIDIDGMSSSTTETAGWDINPFFGGSVISTSVDFHPVADGVLNTSSILRLDEGVEINGALVFAGSPGGSSTHMGPGTSQFQEGVEGYIGFSFTTNDSDGPYFGWLLIEVTANNPGGVVTGWAFEDTGAPILTGAVPEPSSLLLFGLAPLLLRRRRRA